MKATRYALTGIMMLLVASSLLAQAPENITLEFSQTEAEKTSYAIDEHLQIKLTAIQNQQQCTEGIDKIKLYCKGCKIIKEEAWHLDDKRWTKHLTLEVVGHKSGLFQITAYRRTDKGVVTKTQQYKLAK